MSEPTGTMRWPCGTRMRVGDKFLAGPFFTHELTHAECRAGSRTAHEEGRHWFVETCHLLQSGTGPYCDGQASAPAEAADGYTGKVGFPKSAEWSQKETSLKPRPDLLPAHALLEAGQALAQRTDRDGDEPGYLTLPVSKYRASLMRHVLAYLAGQEQDPDSGLCPLAHVVSNAAILHERKRRGE